MSNKKKQTMGIMVNGRCLEVDRICMKEAGILRNFWYDYKKIDSRSFAIKKERILEKALDFCKQRAEIRIHYKDDKNLRKSKLKDFDSDFLKHLKDDDILDLLVAAGNMKIISLHELLFEEAVRVMCQKATADIEAFFNVRYDGDEETFRRLKFAVDVAYLPFK